MFTALKENRERCLQKKLEYKQALLFRRQLLVEKGITKWIEVCVKADDDLEPGSSLFAFIWSSLICS